jgi:hypothetical protein
VAFGVLSRGGVSSDGTTCIEPIYTRFDAWGSLIASTAVQAAAAGHYAVPVWAGGPEAGAPDAATSTTGVDASASGGRDAAASGGRDAATSGGRDAASSTRDAAMVTTTGRDAASMIVGEDASPAATAAEDDGGAGGSSNETGSTSMSQGCSTAALGGAPGSDAAVLFGALGLIAARGRRKARRG